MITNLGNFILLAMFICLIWYHYEWHKMSKGKLAKCIVYMSMFVFLIIFIEHIQKCKEIDISRSSEENIENIENFKQNNIINYKNKAILLLVNLTKHPLMM